MIILRQRSYSIFQELRNSGVDRVRKKYLGRIQKGIAEKAGQFSRDQVDKNKKYVSSINTLEEISNPGLARKIVREAREKGDARVFDNNKFSLISGRPSGNYNSSISADKSDLISYKNSGVTREEGKAINAMIDRKNIINLSGDYKDNVAIMSHETGHAMNNTGAAGKIKRIISDIDDKISDKEMSPLGTMNRIGQESKRGVMRYLEESNAWDNGIKLLKENGATKRELEIAKNKRDASLGTYRSAGLARVGNSVFMKLHPKGITRDIEAVPRTSNNREIFKRQEERRSRRKDKSILGQLFNS